MLEINDHLRLVRHEGWEGGFWTIQERCDRQEGTYKRNLWKPVGTLLTREQAERWLDRSQTPEFRPEA